MKVFRRALLALAMVGSLTPTYAAQSLILERKVLSLAAARKIVAAAEAEANTRGVGVVIAVVDSSGTIIELTRMDTAQVASVNVGIGKARTAAIYRRPSRDFEEHIKSGRIAALALAEVTPLQSGVPVLVDGTVVGASQNGPGIHDFRPLSIGSWLALASDRPASDLVRAHFGAHSSRSQGVPIKHALCYRHASGTRDPRQR